MKARLIANSLQTDGIARAFVRLIKENYAPLKDRDDHPTEAAGVLEASKDPPDPFGGESAIDPHDLISVLDGGLADLGIVPYYFSVDARKAGKHISIGSCVAITGDQLRRQFIVSQIDAQKGAVRVEDAEQNSFLVPWDLVEPWEKT